MSEKQKLAVVHKHLPASEDLLPLSFPLMEGFVLPVCLHTKNYADGVMKALPSLDLKQVSVMTPFMNIQQLDRAFEELEVPGLLQVLVQKCTKNQVKQLFFFVKEKSSKNTSYS